MRNRRRWALLFLLGAFGLAACGCGSEAKDDSSPEAIKAWDKKVDDEEGAHLNAKAKANKGR